MPAWPEDVPYRYRFSTYNESQNLGVIRSPFDDGFAKTRRRFNTKIVIRRLTLILSDSEKDELMEWVETDIAGGALSFTWKNPLGDGMTETVKLVVPDGGLRPRRLESLPEQIPRWSLQIVAEVQP